MRARGDRLAVVVALGVVMAAGSVAAQPVGAVESVLVAPVQGSEALRVQHGERVVAAVRRALLARGYQDAVSQELLGQAVVACQTPECVERTLDAARAAFAIVPAIWARQGGGEELTLTLVQRSGRSLNANEVMGDDLSGAAARLVDELLARQAEAVAAEAAAAAAAAVAVPDAALPSEPAHPHAWKAGPIILIAGGAGAIVAVGVAAGIRTDTQQLNTAAAATWSTIGVAAIAGGIAWWVVGEKRRRREAESTGARAPTIAFRPTGIDLRLRF
jgi:hypothetical protein